MNLTVENLEKNMAKLTVTVPASDFVDAMKASYNKQKSKFSVPGFRKGKVPQMYLEKAYGPELFYEDAANTCIQDTYADAMDESKLDIVSRPEIDVDQMEKGKDFIYTALVAVKPEVTLGDYKGIEIEKVDTEVTDEDVEAALLNEQKQNARNVPVEDRPAKLDDEVTIDFEGFVDGEAFEGGKGENYQLTLGSHSFIDTFEDQIVGKNIGDEFDVNVTFPEDYQAEDLAGKPAMFKVKINSIQKKELPELNDEFAKDTTEFETLDEYKADIEKKLKEKKEKDAKDKQRDEALTKIVAASEMDIPAPMIDLQKQRMVEDFGQRLSMQGLKIEQYLQFTGLTPDKFMDQMEPAAKKDIEQRLVLEAIAKAENIEISDEELEEEFKSIADSYGMDLENVKKVLGDKEKETVREDLAVRKAADIITGSVVAK